MEVFILMEQVTYESDEIAGVYATWDLAKKAMDIAEAKDGPRATVERYIQTESVRTVAQ